jgi:tetratricopeptide (TPR) repeat protein
MRIFPRKGDAQLAERWKVLFTVLAAAAAGGRLGAQAPAADPQGKIVTAQGRVEHAQARLDVWTNARLFQDLFVDERVRTVAASRAAVLFIDETQVKLNAGAVLTVRQVRARGGAAPTTFDLFEGEGWFRTKNPASGVTVTTPAAAATIRGTEINVRVQPGAGTVLTVIEGTAEFANPQGSILVFAGEEATALPGQAPTKQVLLNPDNAVQWVLYYPVGIPAYDLPDAATTGAASAGFDQLRGGDAAAALQAFGPAPADVWARIGASIAHTALGEAAQARAVLEPGPASVADGLTPAAAVARHAQLAAALMAAGDAAGARAEIAAALVVDSTAPRPLALLSSIELQQNRAAEARRAADTALAAHPQSLSALLAASEAAQAAFDLGQAERHLDAAIGLDPRDVRALVNRARLRFGRGDTGGARTDAAAASAVAPSDGQVRSLQGLIRLADGDIGGATRDFEAAVSADPELGEPHLGLGLVHFREQRVNEGLLEMLTATLVEPKVSLYQSYLGKAYYQLRRFPEGLSALETAKRLDPRDPTPWLYASLYLRDQNRQVDALQELRQAIALNDNRAVYRSRLLLDRDLATKNVSLAEVYRQLGFEAWGAFEALRSLESDFTNASAHLFLGETYGNLPDRTQALGAELLQYFLYAPVNRNSFNNFAEYTALLEQPRRQLRAEGRIGNEGHGFGDLVLRTGNERFAHTTFIEIQRRDGFRPTARDDRRQAFAQGKLAFDGATDLFFSATSVEGERGADEVLTETITSPTGPVLVRRYNEAPDPYETNRESNVEAAAGFRRAWSPGATLTAAARIVDLEIEKDVNAPYFACGLFGIADEACPIRTINRVTLPLRSTEWQVQQVARVGRHQLLLGADRFALEEETLQYLATTVDGVPDFEVDLLVPAEDDATSVSVRDEVQVTPWLHASAGVRYQRFAYTDRRIEDLVRFTDWLPMVGAALRVAPSTVVRAAAFRNRNSNFIGSKIAPTTLAGFAIERNELPTTRRTEGAVAVEHVFPRAFVGGQGFVREADAPPFRRGRNPHPEADATTRGASAYLNWILAGRLSVFADDQFSSFDGSSYDRRDNVLRAGASYLDPRGLQARVTVSRVHQRFSGVNAALLPPSSFTLVDAQATYEFAGKRGLATFVATNLFDATFASAVESLSIEQWLPRRRVVASLAWRIW